MIPSFDIVSVHILLGSMQGFLSLVLFTQRRRNPLSNRSLAFLIFFLSAEHLSILPHNRSRLVNELFNRNFFDLVNGFSVEEAS